MSGDSVLIGASMAVLVVLSLLAFFFSSRRRAVHTSSSQRSVVDDVEQGRRPCDAAAAGLDEAVLAAYPTTVYSLSSRGDSTGERSEEEEAADSTRCAVCLADYEHGEELRLLPGCRHSFHRQCVDVWLRRRPSCPLCRSSPPPTMHLQLATDSSTVTASACVRANACTQPSEGR
ncbi:E3 ubiquitin-protein ligase EL5-like [Lolium rigidum]|uniref:E3 ubiquitin-protein ligase EL5-like n=1 Tax=Lolium rigidum TaxID=89674 RepID=UPI001F5CDF93|nr:E3 ubiquitin-protein ligase EL5-like [Lolium rigidum]